MKKVAVMSICQPRKIHLVFFMLNANAMKIAGNMTTSVASMIPSGKAGGAMNIPMIPPTTAAMIPPTEPRIKGAIPASTVASSQNPPPPA